MTDRQIWETISTCIMSFSTNLYRFYIITIQYKFLKGAFSRTSESSFLGSRDACRPLSYQLVCLLISSLLLAFLSLQREGEKCHSPAIGYLVIVWLVTECETPSHLRFLHWILRYHLCVFKQHSQVSTSQWSILSSTYHMELKTYRGSYRWCHYLSSFQQSWRLSFECRVLHMIWKLMTLHLLKDINLHMEEFLLWITNCLNVRIKNNINVNHPNISTISPLPVTCISYHENLFQFHTSLSPERERTVEGITYYSSCCLMSLNKDVDELSRLCDVTSVP